MKYEMQNEFFEMIEKEVVNNKVSHAYLIETNGFEITDKFVKQLLKMLLCPNGCYRDSDSHCNVCDLIDAGNYPDVKMIDSSNVIKKEQLLDVIDSFKSESVYNGRQIYVVLDAAKLNDSSSNTILKFLEEPTSSIVGIFFVNSRYEVLETILSRCQILTLVSDKEFEISEVSYNFFKTLFDKNKGFLAYDELLGIAPDKNSAVSCLKEIEEYFFLVVNGKIKLEEYFSYLNDEKIYKLILIIEDYLKKMVYNLNYKLTLDNLLIDISEVL